MPEPKYYQGAWARAWKPEPILGVRLSSGMETQAHHFGVRPACWA